MAMPLLLQKLSTLDVVQSLPVSNSDLNKAAPPEHQNIASH